MESKNNLEIEFKQNLKNFFPEIVIRIIYLILSYLVLQDIEEPNTNYNQSLLSKIGHAFVSYGMYYNVRELNDMRIWLCPVTEYVFGGSYPREIFVKVVNNRL